MGERDAAARVSREALEALADLCRATHQQVQEGIDLLLHDYQTKVRSIRDEEEMARIECDACRDRLRTADSDERGTCRDDLREAKRRLVAVRSHLRRIEGQYQRSGRRIAAMREQLCERLPNAGTFLREKIERLREYEGIGHSELATAVVIPPPGVTVQSMLSGEVQAGLIGVTSLPRGFRWLSLSDLDLPRELSGISSAADFPKVPYDEMRSGFERLANDVLPVLVESPDVGTEYFRNVDLHRGQDYATGLQRIYEAFFGHHDFIYAVPRFDSLELINGRHRVWVARALGWKAVPAKVKARHE